MHIYEWLITSAFNYHLNYLQSQLGRSQISLNYYVEFLNNIFTKKICIDYFNIREVKYTMRSSKNNRVRFVLPL